jgi:hypothetical protein
MPIRIAVAKKYAKKRDPLPAGMQSTATIKAANARSFDRGSRICSGESRAAYRSIKLCLTDVFSCSA